MKTAIQIAAENNLRFTIGVASCYCCRDVISAWVEDDHICDPCREKSGAYINELMRHRTEQIVKRHVPDSTFI